ncbi:2Fe-2S iron-sulfur cluster-binding protein, partial [Lutispora sp.]|uniref:2Fe-2S iron-sulfur cluster-binding protein n=1 Tax=Lutispora sp. TaxID=2828727 RepID=UPI003569BD36
MYTFKLNGKTVSIEEDKNLLEYLREDENLISVKDGCSEGACGACMVLLDGKAVRACLQTIAKIDGKSVITLEGLKEEERKIYAWAFAEAGAVQCGFCIPGMII